MNGPSVDTLGKLEAQTRRLLDEPVRLCPNGGRVLGKQKIGGYSARKVVHWVETGCYPDEAIKPWCGDVCCVDCGRPGFEAPPELAPQPAQPHARQPAPPPPVPSPVSAGAAARVVERGGAGGLERSSRALVPAPVPTARSSRRPPPRWVVPVVLRGLLVVVVFVVCVVAVQAVSAGVSELREVLVVRTGDVPSAPPSSDEGGPVLPG